MCFSDIIYITFPKYDFFHNHQEKSKKSASYQQITTKSTVNYKLLTVNYKLLFPGGPIPQNMARALIPRQPYSEAVPSTGGRLHPLPFWKGRGLGSGLRTLPQGRDRWGIHSTVGRFSSSSLRGGDREERWSLL